MASSSSSISSQSETKNSIFAFQERGWDLQDIADKKVTATFLKYFRAFVEDAERRSNTAFNGEKKEAFQAMEQGAWYPNRYYDALMKHGQKDRYEYLKKKGILYHGFAPKGFNHVKPLKKDPLVHLTDFVPSVYILGKDITPSDGLNNLLPLKNERFYTTDCQIPIEIGWYCTLREIFGKDSFNDYFVRSGSHPLRLDYDLSETPLLPFLEIRESFTPCQGDNCYFRNVPLYHSKHPQGEGGGWHVACVEEGPNPKYIGFGLLPSPESEEQGVDQDGIFELLADEFNEKPYKLEEFVEQTVLDATQPDPYSPEEQAKIEAVTTTKEEIASLALGEHKGNIGFIPEPRRLSSEKIKEFLVKD